MTVAEREAIEALRALMKNGCEALSGPPQCCPSYGAFGDGMSRENWNRAVQAARALNVPVYSVDLHSSIVQRNGQQYAQMPSHKHATQLACTLNRHAAEEV